MPLGELKLSLARYVIQILGSDPGLTLLGWRLKRTERNMVFGWRGSKGFFISDIKTQ
jgi:hypothetical protein